MMKKFIFQFTLAVCGLSASLMAYDNCCLPQTDCVECDPCFDNGFTGFYVGGNMGVLTHIARRNDFDGFLTDNSGWTTSNTNFAGGVQFGYDRQCCNGLLGLVVDWNGANHSTTIRDNPNAIPDSIIRNELDWFTTIRARTGLVVSNVLFYLTGGVAIARFNTRWQEVSDSFRNHEVRVGWTGGVGTEFKMHSKLSLGAEVLFMHFDDKNKTFADGSGTLFTFGHNDSAWAGRIMLNYRI